MEQQVLINGAVDGYMDVWMEQQGWNNMDGWNKMEDWLEEWMNE